MTTTAAPTPPRRCPICGDEIARHQRECDQCAAWLAKWGEHHDNPNRRTR